MTSRRGRSCCPMRSDQPRHQVLTHVAHHPVHASGHDHLASGIDVADVEQSIRLRGRADSVAYMYMYMSHSLVVCQTIDPPELAVRLDIV
jgi:head-tail adaptor